VTADNPTIIDVVRATDGEADDVLDLILRHQEAERDHWAAIEAAWRVEAAIDAARHGPIRDWYIEHFTEELFFDGTHPSYLGRGGRGAM
jgi:hypothetical protein